MVWLLTTIPDLALVWHLFAVFQQRSLTTTGSQYYAAFMRFW
ncbi:MAG TPA: hypothetical protein V6D10_03015 [Trichocoleus sp.]